MVKLQDSEYITLSSSSMISYGNCQLEKYHVGFIQLHREDVEFTVTIEKTLEGPYSGKRMSWRVTEKLCVSRKTWCHTCLFIKLYTKTDIPKPVSDRWDSLGFLVFFCFLSLVMFLIYLYTWGPLVFFILFVFKKERNIPKLQVVV